MRKLHNVIVILFNRMFYILDLLKPLLWFTRSVNELKEK